MMRAAFKHQFVSNGNLLRCVDLEAVLNIVRDPRVAPV